jgi:hypothetical protein
MGITFCCSKVDQYNDNSVHYRSWITIKQCASRSI